MGKRYVSLDCETTGLELLKGDRAFALSLCDDQGKQWYFDWPVDPLTRQPDYHSEEYRVAVNNVKLILKKYDVIVYHNAKFDRRAIGHCPGLDFILSFPWEDTIFLSHVIDSGGSHSLKDLALRHLEIDDSDEKELRKVVNKARAEARRLHPDWKLGPSAGEDYWLPKALNPKSKHCERYCRLDTKRTMLLWLCLSSVLDDKLQAQYEGPTAKLVMQPISDMETRGVTLRTTALRREISRYTRGMEEAHAILTRTSKAKDLNPNSYPQLVNILQGWAIPTETTAATPLRSILSREQAAKKPRKHVIDFVTALLAYRMHDSARKYLQSYKDNMVVIDARVAKLYPSFNPTGTHTTRLSSSSPNAQNIGKGKELIDEEGNEYIDFSLRTVFGPGPGRRWYAFDYNQLQLRIFAYASKEQSIIDAFDAGWDFHSFVASRLFNTDKPTKIQRRVAKNLNFCLIFGGSPRKADLTAGMPGAYNLFRKQFPSIDRYMQSTIDFVREHGCVYTLGGYRLSVPPEKPYVGTNYIIQGTEGEIVKAAMVSCDEYMQSSLGYLTLQVHDELVFDFKHTKVEPLTTLRGIKYRMEQAGMAVGVKTPVDCERIICDYASGKKVKL